MALTRAMLKAMSIEEEKVDQIIEAHAGVVDGLKAERDSLKEDVSALKAQAEKVPDLEKKIQELEDAKPSVDWESKHNELKKEFDEFKEQVKTDNVQQEKQRLYEAVVRELGITKDKVVQTIVSDADLENINIVDGSLENRDAIKEAVKDEWSDFIPVNETKGADVPEPQGTSTSTGANQSTVARLQERHERLYGKNEKE